MKNIHFSCIAIGLLCGAPHVYGVTVENIIPPPPPPPPPPSDNSFFISKNASVHRDIIIPPPPPPVPELSDVDIAQTTKFSNHVLVTPAKLDYEDTTRMGSRHSDDRNDGTQQTPWVDSRITYPPIYPSFPKPSQLQNVDRMRSSGQEMYSTTHNDFYPTPPQQQRRSYVPPFHPTSYSQHRPPRIPKPLVSPLLQQMTKTLDKIADVDDIAQDMLHSSATLVKQAAQNVKRSSQYAAGNALLSGAAVVSSLRGWMNQWQEQAWGALRGAPTQSDDAKTEWDEDRRISIAADRKRRWLGMDSKNSQDQTVEAKSVTGPMGISQEGTKRMDGGHGMQPPNGEPTTQREPSPFQKQLASLVLPMAKDHEDDSDVDEGGELNPQGSPERSVDSSAVHRVDVTNANNRFDKVWDSSNDIVSVQPRDPREIFVTQGRFDVSVRTKPSRSDSSTSYSSSDKGQIDDPIKSVLGHVPTTNKPSNAFSMYDLDKDEDLSLLNKAGNLVHSISTKIPFWKTRRDSFTDSDWSEYKDEALRKAQQPVKTNQVLSAKQEISPPLIDEIKQRQALNTPVLRQNTINLLSPRDIQRCGNLGRVIASFDFTQFMLVFLATRQLIDVCPLSSAVLRELPKSWTQVQTYLKGIMDMMFVVDWMNSWFLYTCIAAMLTGFNRYLLFQRKIELLSEQIGTSVQENALYAQLYSRVMVGYPLKPSLSRLLKFAAGEQVYALIAASRLRAFFTLTSCVLLLVTLSVDFSFLHFIWKTMVGISGVEVLRRWPIEWNNAYETLKSLLLPVSHELIARARKLELMLFDNPVPLALNMLFVIILYVISRMPTIETFVQSLKSKRTVRWDGETDNVDNSLASGTSLLSNMGASSANRINMVIPDGSLQLFLDRWRSTQQRNSNKNAKSRRFDPFNDLITKSVYHGVSIFLLMIPLALQAFIALNYEIAGEWGKLMDMLIAILATYSIAQESIMHTNRVFQFKPCINMFYQRIEQCSDNNYSQQKNYPAEKKLKDVASPSHGIEVRDFWAAHVSKR